MDKWVKIKLHKIEEPIYFWGLFDELLDDQSEFICNKETILEAYKNGNMYGLMVEETDEMYEKLENEDLFCHDMSGERQGYLLPCFCITNDSTAIIIWTHTRARRKGFATKLVNLLKIECAQLPLPESINFWKSCKDDLTQKIKERKERKKIEQQEQFWNDINAGFFGWELTENHPFYKTFLLWKEMKKEKEL